jgi:hypothetical protein
LNVIFDTLIEERSGYNVKYKERNKNGAALDYSVVAAVQGRSLEHETEALKQSLAKYGLHCCNYKQRTRRKHLFLVSPSDYPSDYGYGVDLVTITLAKVE